MNCRCPGGRRDDPAPPRPTLARSIEPDGVSFDAAPRRAPGNIVRRIDWGAVCDLAPLLRPGRLPRPRRAAATTRSSTTRSGSRSGGCCWRPSLVGALPRRRPGALAWAALGLLAAFVAWTALSLDLDRERRADLRRPGPRRRLPRRLRPRHLRPRCQGRAADGRRGRRRDRPVAIVGLLSRLHPAWFPSRRRRARFLSRQRERLSYPLNYWNALAALIAIGLPLMLQVATGARVDRSSAPSRPPRCRRWSLTAFLTLSRGGIAAAVARPSRSSSPSPRTACRSCSRLLAAAGRRHPDRRRLPARRPPGRAAQRGRRQSGQRDAADDDRRLRSRSASSRPALAMLGLRAGRGRAGRSSRGARRASRRRSALLAILIAALAVDAPGRASNGWSEFKQPASPGPGTARLTSVAGEARYQFWRAAAAREQHQAAHRHRLGHLRILVGPQRRRQRHGPRHPLPLHADARRARHRRPGPARPPSSLLVLVGGAWLTVRAGPRGRPQLAAALAGCTAFCLVAAFDWMWQIPVLPVALLLLGAALRDRRARSAGGAGAPLAAPLRAAFAVLAAGRDRRDRDPARLDQPGAPERSRRSRRRPLGRPRGRRAAPRTCNPAPRAAPPAGSRARGTAGPAAAPRAARAATERESTNWRTWLVLSRIEAERGRAAAAIRDYRKAKSLNPRFSLFSNAERGASRRADAWPGILRGAIYPKGDR